MTSDPKFLTNRQAVDETEFHPPSTQRATELPGGSAAPPASEYAAGNIVSNSFRLEKQLGSGGMGEAWKAYEIFTKRFVVLKFVPKEIQHIADAMVAVRESFNKIHTLQHQHICPVYGLFSDKGYGLYLVMKHIDGVTLNEYKRKQFAKHGKMSFSDVTQILWGIAKGLDYAHHKMVIHRDVKPQNVMISKTDGVQIIDFGIAEEIRAGMAMVSEIEMTTAGTRSYMAPEQWRGRLQDARTDQYALAVTAYELLAGHQPFRVSDPFAFRECVLNDDPEPIAGFPEHVNAALLKALSKKREDRFPDCKSFVKTLAPKHKTGLVVRQGVVPSLPSDAEPGKTPAPIWLPSSLSNSETKNPTPVRPKNAWIIGLAIAASALLLVMFGYYLGKAQHQPPASPSPTSTQN